MKLETVKALIDRMAASGDRRLDYREGDWTLVLTRSGYDAKTKSSYVEANEVSFEEPNPSHVLSPLYGIVHLQPAPDAAPFVTVGQEVRAGTALCVIEAMKVFNPVYAEKNGKIDSILIQSGQEVEVGQVLMSIA